MMAHDEMRHDTPEAREFLRRAEESGRLIAATVAAAVSDTPGMDPGLMAMALLQQLTSQVAETYRPLAGCRGSGCNACCHAVRIPVASEEMAMLAPHVSPEAWDRALALDGLTQEQADDHRCPLLDPATGGCSVYGSRPMVCRGYLVLTPAENCRDNRPIRIIGGATAFAYAAARGIWTGDPFRSILWRELVRLAKCRRDNVAPW